MVKQYIVLFLLLAITLCSLIGPTYSVQKSHKSRPSMFLPSEFSRTQKAQNLQKIRRKRAAEINHLSALKNSLANQYSSLFNGKASALPKDSKKSKLETNGVSIKQNMKNSYQNMMKQYQKSQVDIPISKSQNYSNIDNGKNNSIDGVKNIVYQGDDNKIKGKFNRVNGNSNSIKSNNNFVHGNGNTVMQMPDDFEGFDFKFAFDQKEDKEFFQGKGAEKVKEDLKDQIENNLENKAKEKTIKKEEISVEDKKGKNNFKLIEKDIKEKNPSLEKEEQGICFEKEVDNIYDQNEQTIDIIPCLYWDEIAEKKKIPKIIAYASTKNKDQILSPTSSKATAADSIVSSKTLVHVNPSTHVSNSWGFQTMAGLFLVILLTLTF